jgi:uncharacterized membrane protein (UPF0127 family)
MKKMIVRKSNGNFKNFDCIDIQLMDNFTKRLKGLMFTKQLAINEGALFVNKSENKIDSAIHMLFMNFDIAVFWINNSNFIVDKAIAKKWYPFYYPRAKASKILETHVNNYEQLQIGDQIIIESN